MYRYAIEDPFQGTLRLSILCDGVRRDVLGDENIRNSAFTLDDEKDHEEEEDVFTTSAEVALSEDDPAATANGEESPPSIGTTAPNVEDAYQ